MTTAIQVVPGSLFEGSFEFRTDSGDVDISESQAVILQSLTTSAEITSYDHPDIFRWDDPEKPSTIYVKLGLLQSFDFDDLRGVWRPWVNFGDGGNLAGAEILIFISDDDG